MPAPELYIGIMSGTSLDGVDAVLADFSSVPPKQLTSAHIAFEQNLRDELLTLCSNGAPNELERAAIAGIALAKTYSHAVHLVMQQARILPRQVLAIGCHGQTIRHRPEYGFTIQIGNAPLLAELTDISVVADFRNRDIAAGGQGAPLVPAFHNAVFFSNTHDRVIANIGGIANLTYLPRGGNVTGFDCGPGNVLMDLWTMRHRSKPFDVDGAWAMTGKLQNKLLEAFWQDAYFNMSPPKSTGRERFNLQWLDAHGLEKYRPEDVQRTLLEFTARGIAHGIRTHCGPAQQVFVCGGGTQNHALMNVLTTTLVGMQIATTDTLGISGMNVEALAFAWLARQAIRGEPGNLPAVTGARHTAILGAIYPR